MSHDPGRKEYRSFQLRLQQGSIGLPDHPALFPLLAELFSPEEAAVASVMPMKLTGARRIATLAGLDVPATQAILDSLAQRGLVFDLERPDGKTVYFLNPPMVGFFEFSMNRIRTDIDQDKVARLMWDYLRADPDQAFARMMFEGPTFLTRPLVNEDVLPPSSHTEILDWERGTAIVEGAGSWAEGLCYCRHVARRLGNGCDYPPDSCLSLGVGAEYLIRNGMARRIDKVRALEILADSRARGMVQMCDNVKQRPTFICNCCPCCCEILEGIRMLKNREAIITSGWLAVSDEDGCNGCNKCVKACPVEAIRLVPASPTGRAPKRKTLAVVNADTCLGCGVCVPHCKFDALSLKKNAARFHTPESMMEKMMLQALERGKLQNLLFDDPKRLSHRVLNALVRMILTLPPTKAVLARDQVKSTFVRLALDGFKKSPQGWMAKAT
jgi:Na+-translocating ferredoxin:NAD+ oxidoreductase RNF subunit RnfB